MKIEKSVTGRLSPRQRRFFEELKTSKTIQEAQVKAGYSPKYNAVSKRVLQNPTVIEKLYRETGKTPTEVISQDFVLGELLGLYGEAKREATKVSILELFGKFRSLWDKPEQRNQIVALIGEITKPILQTPDNQTVVHLQNPSQSLQNSSGTTNTPIDDTSLTSFTKEGS